MPMPTTLSPPPVLALNGGGAILVDGFNWIPSDKIFLNPLSARQISYKAYKKRGLGSSNRSPNLFSVK
jgi:hypothetical protein